MAIIYYLIFAHFTLPAWITLYSNYLSTQGLDPALLINLTELQTTSLTVPDNPEYAQQ